MLSLVAYDNSDSEDEYKSNEEDEPVEDNKVGLVKIIKSENEDIKLANIFESLPQPQLNSQENVSEEEEDEFLKKKEIPNEKPRKKAVKISVPSLADFDSDDDELPAKKPKMNIKSCGLFALLPPPKTTPVTTKHFIPNVVKKNANSKNINPVKKSTPSVNKRNLENKTNEPLESDDDEDIKDLPDTFDDEMWQKVCGRKEKRKPKDIVKEAPENNKVIQSDPEVKKPYDGLDNLAFKELIGANSKRKGETIDIVDINEDEILSDKKIWMTKSLTDPEMAPKYVVKNPVNDTCKRKHHITYLAQQAKANEQELQNQWASSRFTRQKTQAKYGF